MVAAFSVSASPLPFSETFDTLNQGAVDSQNGWVALSGTAIVQTNVAAAGPQALEMRNAQVTHSLSNSVPSVWVGFQTRIAARPDANPVLNGSNASVVFFVNTNLNLVVYSNQTPITLSQTIPTNTWIRFDIYCDYENLKWMLSVNGSCVAANLSLSSTNRQMESVLLSNNSTNAVYVDELAVQETEPAAAAAIDTDGDSIPDWWEQRYFGGITNVSAGGMAANGMTFLQTYIAGLNPENPNDTLLLTKGAGRSLSWDRKPGRQYEIYWSSNLTSGFTYIQTVEGDEFEDTNTDRTAEPAGFYQIRVRK